MCDVLHEVDYNAYTSLHSDGGGRGGRACALPLPARVRAAQQAKLQLRAAQEQLQPPLTYRELQQQLHALFYMSTSQQQEQQHSRLPVSSSSTAARLRGGFVRLLLRADTAACELLQPLLERWHAEENDVATATTSSSGSGSAAARRYDDEDEEATRVVRGGSVRGASHSMLAPTAVTAAAAMAPAMSWLLRMSVTSARVMAVLRCRQAVLCDGCELSFQDLLDRLHIAGALREWLSLGELRQLVQLLGPNTAAAVESTLSAFVREHNGGSGGSSATLRCDAAAVAAHLRQHVRPVLHTSSSMTSHYYVMALDDLLDADEVAHAAEQEEESGNNSHSGGVDDVAAAGLLGSPSAAAAAAAALMRSHGDGGNGGGVAWSRVKVPAQRAVLCEWLFAFCMRPARVRLRMETYFLGMALFDRYAAVHPLRREEVLLYGCAALLLASKYEEIYLLSLRVLLDSAEHKFTAAQLMDAEQHVALALDFRVATATVSQIANALVVNQDPPASTRQRQLLHYILATLTVRMYYGHYKQSLLAATAVHLSRVLCGVRSGGAAAPSAAVRALLPSVYAALQMNATSATVGRQLYQIFAQKEHGQVSVSALSESAAARLYAVVGA